MARSKAVDAVSKLVGVLEPLEGTERIRAIQAALTLLGEGGISDGGGGDLATIGTERPLRVGEKSYFDEKKPRTKGEELAVAARYREEREGATASTKAELAATTTAARRNFDASNFRRDIENARVKGLFTRGSGKDSVVLSHYGQSYVDALPDRNALKALDKPKGARARRKARKKAAARRPRKR